jgi:predicted RNA-binding protein
MKTFIIGYPSNNPNLPEALQKDDTTLVEFTSAAQANDEAEEYVLVRAETFSEATRDYERAFIEWQVRDGNLINAAELDALPPFHHPQQ